MRTRDIYLYRNAIRIRADNPGPSRECSRDLDIRLWGAPDEFRP